MNKTSQQLIKSWIILFIIFSASSCRTGKLANSPRLDSTATDSHKSKKSEYIPVQNCDIYTVSTRKGQVFLGPGTEYGLDNVLLEKSEKVVLVKSISQWAYVYMISKAKAGWMHKGFLTEFKNPIQKLTLQIPAKFFDNGNISVSNANLRKGPGVQYPKVGVIYKKEQVKILQKTNDWYKIWIPSSTQVAWIKKELMNE